MRLPVGIAKKMKIKKTAKIFNKDEPPPELGGLIIKLVSCVSLGCVGDACVKDDSC